MHNTKTKKWLTAENLVIRACVALLVIYSAAPASSIVVNLFSSKGLFNNTAMNAALTGTLNSATFGALYHGGQLGTSFNDAAVVGVSTVPVGSTDVESDGVFGGIFCGNITTNCVGGSFYGMANANGTGSSVANRIKTWGMNPLLSDRGFNHVLLQNEFDVNVTGPDTLAFGISIVGASTVAPVAGSAAISLGVPGTGLSWPSGFIFQDSSVGNGDAIYLGLQATGNTKGSQLIRMPSTDGVGAVHTAGILGFPVGGAGGGMLFAIDSESNSATSQYSFNSAGTTKLTINHDGSQTQTGVAFANLPTVNGSLTYCTNCNIANPCTAGGTGAYAKRLSGVNVCN